MNLVMRALVMAGGEGRRLRPLTNGLPKPLLPVGDKPILEHVLLQLRQFEIRNVTLAVAHLAPMIEMYFGSGTHLGMQLSYLREDVLLGTAGAVSRLADFDESIVMMNGDILTDLDLMAMLDEHRLHQAALTVASKVMYTDLSLGVLDVNENGIVLCYREKPQLSYRVGLGIYIIDPVVKAFMRPGERVDMPELINRLICGGRTVATYQHNGKWIDIGTPEEYARVEEESRLQTKIQAIKAKVASVHT